ncbi:hypothetical protein OC834_004391 [Tilletia horrida]|nr:hypothetical protein OC835_007888 [Tilletia horrida]KAK0527531.1 hypothetical protein OC834_004391 [Tilletia horrida]
MTSDLELDDGDGDEFDGRQGAMKAIQGALLTCDPALKQLILHLEAESGQRFVLQDLDATHLFINPKYIDFIRENLNDELEKNTYTLEVS